MSLHDPARRLWGTAKGARAICLAAWAVVAGSALLSAAWWVRMLQGDGSASTPSIVAFNVSIFAGIGALAIDLMTAQRRGHEESAALPHLPGAWFTGAGIGTILAVAIAPGHSLTLLPWGLGMLIVGGLVFVSPSLLERHRGRRADLESRTRAAGIRTTATVTNVSTFYRRHTPHYRVTMRFTDTHGAQRWFTQTAPARSRQVGENQSLPLHYDPANPGRRATLVIDWPSY